MKNTTQWVVAFLLLTGSAGCAMEMADDSDLGFESEALEIESLDGAEELDPGTGEESAAGHCQVRTAVSREWGRAVRSTCPSDGGWGCRVDGVVHCRSGLKEVYF